LTYNIDTVSYAKQIREVKDMNQPLRRFGNLLSDATVLTTRWTPWLRPFVFSNQFLRVPANKVALSKADDPDWRKNWYWVVLASTENLNCRPFYTVDDQEAWWGMRTLFPLKTRLFAMRLGPSPFRLTTIDNSGLVSRPCFFNPERQDESIYVASYTTMSQWAVDSTRPITFI